MQPSIRIDIQYILSYELFKWTQDITAQLNLDATIGTSRLAAAQVFVRKSLLFFLAS